MQRRSYSAGGRAGRRPSAHNRSRSSYSKGSNNRGRGRRGSTIDPSRFVKAARPVDEVQYTPTHTFADFDIHSALKKNIAARGFTTPTQIQDYTIPLALQGRDVVGIANTGTGKTAAFLIPLINYLAANPGKRILVMAPTRELALQIQDESRQFAVGSGLKDTLLIGGVPIGRQLQELKKRPSIVIGTPGRIKDHLEQRSLKLDRTTKIVLDEVDRMLDMGFINDIRAILNHVPKERQSLFFSATMNPAVSSLINTFTNEPKTIMARTSETSDNVEQAVAYYSDKNEKMDTLHNLLISDNVTKTLVFTETKYGADRLAKSLEQRGFKVDAIHGNKSQGKRQRALTKFRKSEVDVLVATDVAARGIDVDNISHIVNYEVPQTYDDYTHRIGRVGRAGKIGHALTLVQK